MSSIKFTQKAKEQIRAIRIYSMRQWGSDMAKAYETSLKVTITDILARQPSIGRDRSEDLYPGIRSFPVEKHVIYYRSVVIGIEIIAVLHQTQDPHINM